MKETIDIEALTSKIKKNNFLYAEEVRKAKEKEKYLENRLLKLRFEQRQQDLETENKIFKRKLEDLGEEVERANIQKEGGLKREEYLLEEIGDLKKKINRLEEEKSELKSLLQQKEKGENLERFFLMITLISIIFIIF